MKEAEKKCVEVLKMVQDALNNGTCQLNNGEDHVLKIAGHAGHHSEGGVGKIKVAVKQLLELGRFDFYSNLENGVFLVRLHKY